jgi:hypothetical protein
LTDGAVGKSDGGHLRSWQLSPKTKKVRTSRTFSLGQTT